VRQDGKFVSLAKTDDPNTVTIERAAELIAAKAAASSKTPLRTFDEDPAIQVLSGRYGPYIPFEGKNYTIPKSADPQTLTLAEARDIIEKGREKAGRKK
jgi:DNA topoisomerase-1